MRQMAKLPIDVYTQELCAAIDANDFPMVTYDFGPEPDEEFDSESVVIHQNVIEVEGTIRRQLFSVGLNGVKDGLANVLFWGYSTLPGRRSNRVPRFRRKGRDVPARYLFARGEEHAGNGAGQHRIDRAAPSRFDAIREQNKDVTRPRQLSSTG